MLEDVRDQDANENSIVWLASPDTFTLLAARAKATSGPTIIDDGRTLAGKRVVVSSTVPDATLVCMDSSQALLALWGPGPTVELNPFANHVAGVRGARILLEMDFGLLRPSACVVATSVT